MKTVWTGYSDERYENTWNWRVTGTTSAYTTYTNWNSGQPNNSGEKDCGSMDESNGKWNALQCGLRSSFVCEQGG